MEKLKSTGWFFAYWVTTLAGLYAIVFVSQFAAFGFVWRATAVYSDPNNLHAAVFTISFVVALFVSLKK